MRLALIAVVLAGCGVLRDPADSGVSTGSDQALVAGCVSCHQEIGESWKREFSHSQLFDCSQCHQALTAMAGTRHMSSRECSDCHSQTLHLSQPCLVCHDPHGTANVFLVRERLFQGPVSLTAAEGVSEQGLAHGDGTGVCERCHTRTKYARADGTGAPHSTRWCAECHSHQAQFSAR